jgi:hypothetical protein
MTTDWSTLEPGTKLRRGEQIAEFVIYYKGHVVLMVDDRDVWATNRPDWWEPVPPEPRYLREGDMLDAEWCVEELHYTLTAGWVAFGKVRERCPLCRMQTIYPDGLSVDGVVVPWPPAPEDGAA